MIFRISHQLGKKIRVEPPKALLNHENPFCDWCAHLFTVNRAQYIIIANTRSLYSIITRGQGITNDSTFIDRALSAMGEFMKSDGFQFQYERFIAPDAHEVIFSKNANKPVIGSMNDLIYQAELGLTEGMSPQEASTEINGTLLSILTYDNPKEAFVKMQVINSKHQAP